MGVVVRFIKLLNSSGEGVKFAWDPAVGDTGIFQASAETRTPTSKSTRDRDLALIKFAKGIYNGKLVAHTRRVS